MSVTCTKQITIELLVPTFLTLSMPASATPVINATFDPSFNSKWKLFKSNGVAAILVGTAAGMSFTIHTSDDYIIASSQGDANNFWVTGGNLTDRAFHIGTSAAFPNQINMFGDTSPPGTYVGFAPIYDFADSVGAGQAFQLPLTITLSASTTDQASHMLVFSVNFTDVVH